MNMAFLNVIGSGSSGNAYVIDCGNEILLVEAGLSYKNAILPAMNGKQDKVVGCMVSHVHLDHVAHVNEMIQRAIPVYSNDDVAKKYSGVIALRARTKFKIDGFTVQCLPVPHGSTPCYSFIIDHESFGRILFITDCLYFPYKIKGVNHLMIEANYMTDIIENNATKNVWNSSASDTHMEINTTLRSIRGMYSSDMMNIILLHLSNGNSDKYKFIEMVRNEVGIIPYIAEPKLIVELKKEEF